jgi:hypothetical protein
LTYHPPAIWVITGYLAMALIFWISKTP